MKKSKEQALMTTDKRKPMILGAKGKLQLFFGVCFSFLGIVGLAAELEPPIEASGIVLAFAFLTIGLFFLYTSYKSRKTVSHFRLYVNILSDQPSMSATELSQKTGFPEETVLYELQKLIERGFFCEAYIDRAQKRIVFPVLERKLLQEEETRYDVRVICSTCGGGNTLKSGTVGYCIYCKNVISDQDDAKGKRPTKQKKFLLKWRKHI